MVVVPAAWPVAIPVTPTLAALGCDELQVAPTVTFWVLPSLKVAVAVNCCVAPTTSVGLRGVIASEVKVACVTVSPVEPVTESKLALMVVLPLAFAVAVPPFMLATAAFDDFQAARLLRFWLLPSLNVPVAKNTLLVPEAIAALTGLTAIETSVAEVTVKVVEAVKEPFVAVIVVVPGCWLTATLPLMVATAGFDELQLTLLRVCVLPSLYWPTAKNGCVVVLAMTGDNGVMLMVSRLGACTVMVELPLTCSKLAEITAVPGLIPEATPALLQVATVGADEVQLTTRVIFCVLPSLKVPIAVNC